MESRAIGALLLGVVCSMLAYGFGCFIGARKQRDLWRAEMNKADRYARAVDDLDRWCGHASPHAKLIARHLTAHGDGLDYNAGTPSADEACGISGLRIQLQRLDATAAAPAAAGGAMDLTRQALDVAYNGLKWYRDRYPEAVDGSDDEADDLIERALAQPAPVDDACPGPVTQSWVHGISMMQQSVLLAAIRGPDGLAKYGGGAKMLLRWYRRCVLLSAMDRRVLRDPIEPNGGSFTGPSLEGEDDQDHWSDRMQAHVNDYLRQVDALPHHYQLHFLHAVEILGYKHPDAEIRLFWNRLYVRLVHDFHLWPETEEQLDSRLGDSRRGWLNRADPATVE